MWGLLKTDAKLGRPTESQTATTLLLMGERSFKNAVRVRILLA